MLNYSVKTDTLCCFTVEHHDDWYPQQDDPTWAQQFSEPNSMSEQQKQNLPQYSENNMLLNLYKVCRRVCNLHFQYDTIYGQQYLVLERLLMTT